MLLDHKSGRVQSLSEPTVTRLIYAIFFVNETSSSVIVSPTKQGPCSDSARSGPTPKAIYLQTFTGFSLPTRPKNWSETPTGNLSERWPLLTARPRRARDFLVLSFAVQVRNRLGEVGCADLVSLSRISSRTGESASPSKFFLFPDMGSWPWD